ncbi:MAG: hypothetical protein J7L89_01750, partial [Bacteroidales bacterium]|nr:hypothetical protein [Bacteroidales bacterium]
GKAYGEIRFRSGFEFGTPVSELEIREAYVDLNLGWASLRAGKQILAWGRADGFNPTDNLTPRNYFVRSPLPDDMRMGNYALSLNLHPVEALRIELDYLPRFEPSVYRFDLVNLPDYLNINPIIRPETNLSNGIWAVKADVILSQIEGSVSYLHGYDLLPALNPGTMPQPPFESFEVGIIPITFKQQILGADFATSIGKTGLRGEIAWRQPDSLFSGYPFMPHSEWQWSVSLDRSLGAFHLILGYSGKLVESFKAMDTPVIPDPNLLSDPSTWPYLGSMFGNFLEYANRILFDQTKEWSHILLFRPSVKLFHEVLEAEINSFYNFSTKEYFIWPGITWHVSDALNATLGYQYYYGPEFTRLNWVAKMLNGPYLEFRLTF